MGHLINPIAYRLGHSRSWEDNWFIKNIYYPEFLHSILKIREYIYYFWTTRFMEKKGILLSHFYIYKFAKKLLVKIFLYNTDFEKYIYSFFARGVGIFSDSFYYRFKKKKKKKEPFCYERYKPDLFFLLFLYYAYFSKMKIKRKIKIKKAFFFIKRKYNLNKKLINKKNTHIHFNNYFLKKKIELSHDYLNKLKSGDLDFFINLPTKVKKENLNIFAYENKIKELTFKKLNMGFLDFLVYIFFKINMLEKKEEDIIKSQRNKRSTEMILNYPLKFQRWIIILKKYIKTNVSVGKLGKRKRSIKNFIFFLMFLMNIIHKVRKSSSRVKFRLRELNLKLIRLFIFNRVFTQFAFFYGKFLTHILYLLINVKNFVFKFCFITNNSVNAKFLTRYMGLKLKRKFPLFVVVNPLKKEFRKLSNKKREKKYNLLFNFFTSKIDLNLSKNQFNYKKSFRFILTFLFEKYLELSFFYYKNYKTLITTDIYIYFLMLKNKYKYVSLLKIWKRKFLRIFRERSVWNNQHLKKKWLKFLIFLLKTNKLKIYFLNKLKVLSFMIVYIKNKLLLNLLFGSNKYYIDDFVAILFGLRGDYTTFFFFNSDYVFLTIYSFFFNNSLNYIAVIKSNTRYITTSHYFLKSYMFYLYVQYGFINLLNYLKINKKNYYFKMKELYSTSSFILGYKMSFKGRFSRKQRASSVWFHQGFVPLNTIKGSIDYSFFTIPLKNSAISIKLWLYKNTHAVIWDSKFLNKK